MQTLTRNEFLELLNLSSGTFDQLRHAGHVALAFGVPLPAMPGRYLDLDLLAMAVNLGLAQSLGREIATTIVAGFFHQWASAVGHAEADPARDYFMAVAGIGWDEANKGPKYLVLTNGRMDEIHKDFQGTKDLVGYFTVNISDIIRRLRAKAQSLGIDLTRPFFFAPDDPRFGEFLNQVRRERDARIARLRRDKKRRAIAKQQARRGNIEEAPRLSNVPYPPEMQGMLAATANARVSAPRG